MENNETRFENYLAGEMTDTEVKLFNTELNSNEIFKKDYEYFLSIKKATSGIERDNLRNQLNSLELKSITTEPIAKSSNSLSTIIKWILASVALATIAYFSYLAISPSEPEGYYAQHFELYEAQSARDRGTEEAKSLYNQGKYLDFIENVESDLGDSELNMMLANAYMKTQQFTLAKGTLLDISDESSLRDLKYWNLGLINLQEGNLKEAEVHLKHLRSLSNFKKSEIEKILSEIKK